MEIRLSGTDLGMAHQSLHRPEIGPFIQKGSGEGLMDNVNRSVLNQKQGVNGNWGTYSDGGGSLVQSLTLASSARQAFTRSRSYVINMDLESTQKKNTVRAVSSQSERNH
jgi:hypothetical protein